MPETLLIHARTLDASRVAWLLGRNSELHDASCRVNNVGFRDVPGASGFRALGFQGLSLGFVGA